MSTNKSDKEEKKNLTSPITVFIEKKFIELQFQYARNEFEKGIGALFVASKDKEIRAMYVGLDKVKETQFKEIIVRNIKQRENYMFIFVADRHGMRLNRYRKSLIIKVEKAPEFIKPAPRPKKRN